MSIYVNAVKIVPTKTEVRIIFGDHAPGEEMHVMVNLVMTPECFREFCQMLKENTPTQK